MVGVPFTMDDVLRTGERISKAHGSRTTELIDVHVSEVEPPQDQIHE